MGGATERQYAHQRSLRGCLTRQSAWFRKQQSLIKSGSAAAYKSMKFLLLVLALCSQQYLPWMLQATAIKFGPKAASLTIFNTPVLKKNKKGANRWAVECLQVDNQLNIKT